MSASDTQEEIFKFIDARLKKILESLDHHKINKAIHPAGLEIVLHSLEGLGTISLSRTVEDKAISYQIAEHEFKYGDFFTIAYDLCTDCIVN